MDSNSISLDLEHLFRHSYGKIIAALVNKFGSDHIESIEDSVQDALLKGMQIWSYQDLPENPTSWLLVVAKNKMIDLLRKKQKFNHGEVEDIEAQVERPTQIHLDDNIIDDQLRMIFACCHPKLSQESQIILTLKLVAGFHNREVARALLKKEETIAKAFTRSKNRFKEVNPTLAIPIAMGLRSRLNIVLKIIYLIFTEGYAASSGQDVIKKDLCFEAIRLTLLLAKNKYCNQPNLKALLALMCFHASRFDARVDGQGDLIDLEHQDRSLWNHELVEIGRTYLSSATAGPTQPTEYLFQAFISYYHCIAPSFNETQWNHILNLYKLQLKRSYTPLIELNSIVPFYQIHGAEKALQFLQNYASKPHAIKEGLYYALLAKLMADLGKKSEALQSYDLALNFVKNEPERQHLLKKRELLNKN